MRPGLSFVISAPSGAGKTTLSQKLLAEFPLLHFSISCTTRSIRQGEIDGKDYCFLEKQEFERRKNAGEFAEWAKVHGNFYGTPIKPVQEMLQSGRDVLFDIDVQGAAMLKLTFPLSRFIFILPPSLQTLENRLAKRALDSPETLKMRMQNARNEIAQAMWYDALVVNDNLDTAYMQLRSFYMAAKLAPHCHAALLNCLLGE